MVFPITLCPEYGCLLHSKRPSDSQNLIVLLVTPNEEDISLIDTESFIVNTHSFSVFDDHLIGV